jgi:hypothetical protein
MLMRSRAAPPRPDGFDERQKCMASFPRGKGELTQKQRMSLSQQTKDTLIGAKDNKKPYLGIFGGGLKSIPFG